MAPGSRRREASPPLGSAAELPVVDLDARVQTGVSCVVIEEASGAKDHVSLDAEQDPGSKDGGPSV